MDKIIIDTLLETFGNYSIIHKDYTEHLKKNKMDPTNINSLYSLVVEDIDKIIKRNDIFMAYSYVLDIRLHIINNLLCSILWRSAISNISIVDFPNVRTELFPYQISNVNWMNNVEKGLYDSEFDDIKNKYKFFGGGLFDEVGMGKTLQMIALINLDKDENRCKKFTTEDDKLYTSGTLIIAPNHLCGQWKREFEKHLKTPLNIINLLTKAHYKKYTYLDFMLADVIIISSNFFFNCDIKQHEIFDSIFNFSKILEKNVNIFNMKWKRVIIDEYHEMENLQLFEKLKHLNSRFRWILSGTPFKEHFIKHTEELQDTSFYKIIEYLTFSKKIDKIDFTNVININWIKSHFSRNLHSLNVSVLKLPEIVEEIVWLNFSNVERALYNGYLVNDTNIIDDINIQNCENVFLRQLCCHPMLAEKMRSIKKTMESLNDMKEYIRELYLQDYEYAQKKYDNVLRKISKTNEEIEKFKEDKKTESTGYYNLCENLKKYAEKEIIYKKIKDGHEKTIAYYKVFLELLSDKEKVLEQDCPICLDSIKEDDIGVTTCGHIYCYSCISTIIKASVPKCPSCKHALSIQNIYLISENRSKDVENFGTKLGYIIGYIRNTPNKYRIIFSQWNNLLKEVGKILTSNGINNLYCKGNVYQKDTVLKLFNGDNEYNEYKIIMLSSMSNVSGLNLSNVEEIIFLDPIYGDEQFRRNTENQAIGRVRRLGNKFKKIKVLRILIKDSVEEDIYKTIVENKQIK